MDAGAAIAAAGIGMADGPCHRRSPYRGSSISQRQNEVPFDLPIVRTPTRRKEKSMNRIATAFTAFVVSMSAAGAVAQEMPTEYQQVLTTLGRQGDYKANVLKVNIPRSDLNVTVANVKTPTPFGFGGWVAMTRGTGGMDVMMGDLVLTQEEVNPVMSALLENGLEVSALHNPFFWDDPRMFYMHVHGHGKPLELAQKLKPAIALIGKGSHPAAVSAPAPAAPAGT